MYDYIENAIRTESSSWHDPNPRLLHAAMGMMTEVIEVGEALDDDEVRKEIGDIYWYMAIACDELGITFEDLEDAEVDGTVDNWVGVLTNTAVFLDLQKKWIYYGKAMTKERLIAALAQIYEYLLRELDDAGYRLDEILAENIAKLRARYGEKFSEEAAVNR
jgi:hypothetical protein